MPDTDPDNPVMVTRPVTDSTDGRSLHHLIWCPGCDELHALRSVLVGHQPVHGPHWDWDGNATAPTFSPSLIAEWTSGPEHTEHRCHSYIRAGRWEFLGDSTHPLAGQTVPMIPVPDWVAAMDGLSPSGRKLR